MRVPPCSTVNDFHCLRWTTKKVDPRPLFATCAILHYFAYTMSNARFLLCSEEVVLLTPLPSLTSRSNSRRPGSRPVDERRFSRRSRPARAIWRLWLSIHCATVHRCEPGEPVIAGFDCRPSPSKHCFSTRSVEMGDSGTHTIDALPFPCYYERDIPHHSIGSKISSRSYGRAQASLGFDTRSRFSLPCGV